MPGLPGQGAWPEFRQPVVTAHVGCHSLRLQLMSSRSWRQAPPQCSCTSLAPTKTGHLYFLHFHGSRVVPVTLHPPLSLSHWLRRQGWKRILVNQKSNRV